MPRRKDRTPVPAHSKGQFAWRLVILTRISGSAPDLIPREVSERARQDHALDVRYGPATGSVKGTTN